MGEFLMPSLGADMDSGTLLEWNVKAGDEVHRGDIVAVVDTSKAEIEIEIFEDGVVEQILVPEGRRVPVGTVLATVAAGTSRPSAPPVPAEPDLAAAIGAATADPGAGSDGGGAGTPTAAPAPEHRPRVSPIARRMARERGVELSALEGTGPGGAITKDDVERAAGSAGPEPVTPLPEEHRPPVPSGRQATMREAIGALMARSKREIPHYYLGTQIDMGAAMAYLKAENARREAPDRLLPAVLTIKAVALALRDVPELNGFWIDGALRPSAEAHVGVAVSLRGGGLVAPALHDAGGRDLDDLMRGLRDLVARARAGRLRGSEMADPTITVTNLGDRGVETVFGVIYPPQVALVGLGRIAERPWAADGMVGSRPVMVATLSGDHRASDGHTGARFLARLDALLQDPERL